MPYLVMLGALAENLDGYLYFLLPIQEHSVRQGRETKLESTS